MLGILKIHFYTFSYDCNVENNKKNIIQSLLNRGVHTVNNVLHNYYEEGSTIKGIALIIALITLTVLTLYYKIELLLSYIIYK